MLGAKFVDILLILVIIGLVAVAPVFVSYIVAAFKSEPNTPQTLALLPDIPINYTTVEGVKVRYITIGSGPIVVLLHTFRSQLDIYYKIIPVLSKSFTVYAFDYPGHGYSDIPAVDYTPQFFADKVEGFLNDRDLHNITLAGVSIGATLSLMLAAKRNSRIDRVIAINPYDYLGAGIGRGNAIANLVITMCKLPVLGGTTMRLNNRMVERKVMEGTVSNPNAISNEFAEELYLSGTRKGYYQAFLNLIRHADMWNDVKSSYKNIEIPVLLVYGENDWARKEERNQTESSIPNVKTEFVAQGGHWLMLDYPDNVIDLIRKFSV